MQKYQIYGYTEKGNIRALNEDHILVGRFVKNEGGLEMQFSREDDFLSTYGILFAVADGIGGAKGGAQASKLALSAIEKQFYSHEKPVQSPEIIKESIHVAVHRANDAVIKMGENNPELLGMGCTLAGICLTQQGYYVFNAGDSRVYRFRNGVLRPLTQDDTITNLAIQAGQINYKEADDLQSKHTLTNSLGSVHFEVKIEPGPEFRNEDVILICSDGLHNMVEHDAMEKILSHPEPLELIKRRLVNQALESGGWDNISLILIRLTEIEDTNEWRYKEEEHSLPEEEADMYTGNAQRVSNLTNFTSINNLMSDTKFELYVDNLPPSENSER